MVMLFRELTVHVLVVAMLGPAGAVSEIPVCPPPALKCSIFKRSVCERSPSGEPVWVCKAYWEPVSEESIQPTNASRGVEDVVESSADGGDALGNQDHEPEVKIDTYTFPVPSSITPTYEDSVHAGTYVYPFAPNNAAEEASSQSNINSLPAAPLQIPAEGHDGILRIGSIALPQKIIPIDLQTDSNVHLGTKIGVSDQKSLLSKLALDSKRKIFNNLPLPAIIPADSDASTEIRIGTYLYEVPIGRKKAKAPPNGGYHEGARALGGEGSSSESESVTAVKTVKIDPRTILTQQSNSASRASVAASEMNEDSTFQIGTVTYRVPVQVRDTALEVESDVIGKTVRQGESEHEVGTIEYQVPNGQVASLNETEAGEVSGARSITASKEEEDDSSDSEVRFGTYSYRVPKSRASGPNVSEMSEGSAIAGSDALQFGALEYLDGTRISEAEADGTAVHLDAQADGVGADLLSIVSGKQRAEEGADVAEAQDIPVGHDDEEAQTVPSGEQTDSNGAVHVGQMIMNQNGYESGQEQESDGQLSGQRMLTAGDRDDAIKDGLSSNVVSSGMNSDDGTVLNGFVDIAGLNGNVDWFYDSNSAYQRFIAGTGQSQNAAYGYGHSYGFPIYYGYGGYGYWAKKTGNDQYGYYYWPQWVPMVGIGVATYGTYGNQLGGNAPLIVNPFAAYQASYAQISGTDDSGSANSQPSPQLYPYAQYVGIGSLCTLCKFLMSVLMGGTCNADSSTLESSKGFSGLSPYNGS